MVNDEPEVAPSPLRGPSPAVTVVTSPGCHFCVDAVTTLNRHEREGRIALSVHGSDSGDGARLVAEHRPALFPLVLVNGSFFSAGRLPRRKLERILPQAATAGRVR